MSASRAIQVCNVTSQMDHTVINYLELGRAKVAEKPFRVDVISHMTFERSLRFETLGTKTALSRSFLRVHVHVLLQFMLVLANLRTFGTLDLETNVK